MERDPDLINPGWVRLPSWPYEEDWGSPAWNRRMKMVYQKIYESRQARGFIVCPECGTEHTVKTLTCRGCGAHPKERCND